MQRERRGWGVECVLVFVSVECFVPCSFSPGFLVPSFFGVVVDSGSGDGVPLEPASVSGLENLEEMGN